MKPDKFIDSWNDGEANTKRVPSCAIFQKKKNQVNMIVIPFIAISLWPVLAWPTTEVKKREYKTMIKASDYNDNTPCAANPSALSNLRIALQTAATAAERPYSGSFSLKSGMPRTVKFYDTPTDCRLHSNNFLFRMRRSSGEADWEGTLKFRNADRYFSSYRRLDMNSCSDTSDFGGKFEEDLDLLFAPQFSYSHECAISKSKNIDQLDDITETWDQVSSVFVGEFGWTLTNPIGIVSNLTITECVYEGFTVDFDTGDDDEVGEFSVTLWYTSTSATNPSLVEMSFVLTSSESSPEDWNENTIMNAHKFWDQVANLNEIDSLSSTKTEWVYNYDAAWCV